MRKITPYIEEVIAEKVDELAKKNLELLNLEKMVDIIYNVIVKIDKKENVSDKVRLVKRYLRRYYNIDMNSETVKTRIKNLTKQL